MKRRIMALVLVLVMGIVFCGSALASGPVGPMSISKVSCGLTHVSGNTYNVWALQKANTSQNLSAEVYLYRLEGSSRVLVASASKSEYGTSVKAQKNVTIQSGYTYEVNAYGYGESDSSTVGAYYYF